MAHYPKHTDPSIEDRIERGELVTMTGPPEGWDEARAFLREAQTWDKTSQSIRRAEIHQAFRTYWAGAVTEEDFARTTRGLVLTPEMLYIMSGRRT